MLTHVTRIVDKIKNFVEF